MRTHQRVVGTGVLVLGIFGACSSRGGSEQELADPREPNGIIVTTPLVGLPLNDKARLAIIQARPDRRTIPIEVRFKDAKGNVLARRRGVVGRDQPVIEELPRTGLGAQGSVLLQTEILLGPVEPGNGRSCPLHLTLEIVPEDDGHGSGHTCPGVDPCLGGLQGPGIGSTVYPFCVSRPAFLSP
jgi:hypothetical protein